MAILIDKQPSNPNELPSQAWARVTNPESDGGATITAEEAADLQGLWCECSRENFDRLKALTGSGFAREVSALDKIKKALPPQRAKKLDAMALGSVSQTPVLAFITAGLGLAGVAIQVTMERLYPIQPTKQNPNTSFDYFKKSLIVWKRKESEVPFPRKVLKGKEPLPWKIFSGK